MAILQDLNGKTHEELVAMVQALKAKVGKAESNGFKVSSKGAVSVYGLGRFPVTLYDSQWEKLFDKVEALKQFIADNRDRLATKED